MGIWGMGPGSGVGVKWEIADETREWGGMGIGMRIRGMGDRGWGTGLRNGVELEMGNWDRDENQTWGMEDGEWDQGMRWGEDREMGNGTRGWGTGLGWNGDVGDGRQGMGNGELSLSGKG